MDNYPIKPGYLNRCNNNYCFHPPLNRFTGDKRNDQPIYDKCSSPFNKERRVLTITRGLQDCIIDRYNFEPKMF